MTTPKSAEDTKRTSVFYWLVGGDIFWFHFKMRFLKHLLIYIVGVQIITALIVVLFKIQSIPFFVGIGIQVVQALLITLPLFSNKVATSI